MRALSRLDEVDRSRSLWPWLATIAQRLAIDAVRRRRPTVPLSAEVSTGDRTFEAVQRRDVMRRLNGALMEMPARQRRAVLLYADGFGYRDIAASERTTPSSVKSLLFRARSQLRRTFKPGELLAGAPLLRARLRAWLGWATGPFPAMTVAPVAVAVVVAAVAASVIATTPGPVAVPAPAASQSTPVAAPEEVGASSPEVPRPRGGGRGTGGMTVQVGGVEAGGEVKTTGNPEGRAEIDRDDPAGEGEKGYIIRINCDQGTVSRLGCSLIGVIP